jgi:hypothetical protein
MSDPTLRTGITMIASSIKESAVAIKESAVAIQNVANALTKIAEAISNQQNKKFESGSSGHDLSYRRAEHWSDR